MTKKWRFFTGIVCWFAIGFSSFIFCQGPDWSPLLLGAEPISVSQSAVPSTSRTRSTMRAPSDQKKDIFNPTPNNPVPDCVKAINENGLHREVGDYLTPWTLRPENDSHSLAEGIQLVVATMQQLNRLESRDEYLEQLLAVHPNRGDVLLTVAGFYQNDSYGSVIDNQFHRGVYGGQGASSAQRDRVRSLQLLREFLVRLEQDDQAFLKFVSPSQLAYQFFIVFGERLGGDQPALQFQVLTDLETLPGYDEGNQYYRHYHRQPTYAPVDSEGNPLYYTVPESFDKAQSDGQRWRYVLDKASRYKTGDSLIDTQLVANALQQRVSFLKSQFGPGTLSDYRSFFENSYSDDPSSQQDGIWSLHTLADNETIARLANGVKRFSLPNDQNYLFLLQQAYQAKEWDKHHHRGWGVQIVDTRCARRQFTQAKSLCEELLENAPKDDSAYDFLRTMYDRIRKNWGTFEQIGSKANGADIELSYLFRNGNSVSLTAHRLDISQLVTDMKSYFKKLEENPRFDGNGSSYYLQTDIEGVGRQLLQGEEGKKKYLAEEVAKWNVALTPAKDHFDVRTSLALPFSKPGAYLIQATIENGNTDALVVWINDAAIVSKPLDGQWLYFMADAQTGKPLANKNVEFFGYRRQYNERNNNNASGQQNQPRLTWKTKTITRVTDKEGLVLLSQQDQDYSDIQWLVTVQASEKTKDLSWLGFNSFWFLNRHDEQYENIRAYFISDRPVYRPEQKVEFKFWVATAQYDLTKTASWANKVIRYELRDPLGNVVVEKDVTLDQYGGFTDSYPLDSEAKLGNWQLSLTETIQSNVVNQRVNSLRVPPQQRAVRHLGNGSFRVEEYKKPEYEVTIEAPTEPVALGDSFKATIKAKYYFGAPVTHATVKYTVHRTTHHSNWFPVRPWDWFYGNGYWWFGYDYDWYHGWARWGCSKPYRAWFPFSQNPPEVIAEQEVPIGPDGTVEVLIDSALAKAIYPNDDQEYAITAEVIDQSRRTITGKGQVLVAHAPFKVYVWADRGWFEPNQQINAEFKARRLDGKPVAGNAVIKLFRIEYSRDEESKANGIKPTEKEVFAEEIQIDEQGTGQLKLTAKEPGQYRLFCRVTTKEGKVEEGASLFRIGQTEKATAGSFRFDSLELVPDKAEYAPGEKVSLLVNTNKSDSTVLLFVRPINNVCSKPIVLQLDGKTKKIDLDVTTADMPNFFVEALTISNGKVYSEQREIAVPPEKRILNVEVAPSSETYRPAEKAAATIRVTDLQGKPVTGQVVVSIYDKSIEYISGGSNIGDIKSFFWNWKRHSSPQIIHNLNLISQPIVPQGEEPFVPLGGAEYEYGGRNGGFGGLYGGGKGRGLAGYAQNEMVAFSVSDAMESSGQMLNKAAGAPPMPASAAPMSEMALGESLGLGRERRKSKAEDSEAQFDKDVSFVEATVRSNFADTAYWVGHLETDENGIAQIELNMPENLTTWKIRIWSCSTGTRVGEGTTEVITKKNLIVRMQRPRFLTQKDVVVFSANVHNYLDSEKKVRASLAFVDEGEKDLGYLKLLDENAVQDIVVPSSGEQRVDWKVRAELAGKATLVMKVLTDEESDAVKETIPVYVHGMLKQEAISGMIPARQQAGEPVSQTFTLNVPNERRPEETKLTVRFSPTLAGALLEALPYLIEYPYGCTEQTLNRFLPLILVQKSLLDSGIDLSELAHKRTNLNAQELGPAEERIQQWKRTNRRNEESPVFVIAKVRAMTKEGIDKLQQMQCSDGGWGWFSGYGERSNAHLTALVFRGLLMAQKTDAPVNAESLQKGKDWLIRYQRSQAVKLLNGKLWSEEEKKKNPDRWKVSADDTDVFVYLALTEAGVRPEELMGQPARSWEETFEKETFAASFVKKVIEESRTKFSLYALAIYGLALCEESLESNREMIALCVRMLSQYLNIDEENQTAHLDLSQRGNWFWWCWYGNDIETQAVYLKLLAKTDPKGTIAPQLVKYLLNNRKNAVYWNSTRDTALCVEAFVEYLKTTNELNPNTKVDILVNGNIRKSVEVNASNLFTLDNTLELASDEIANGPLEITLRQTGSGPLYYNAYLQNFTLEDPIKKTGLEVKVERRFYLLEKDEQATSLVAGGRGQAINQRVEKFRRTPLADLSNVKSGQMVEVELIVESKNDYESILLEDMKAAGFESVETRSGYNGNSLGAYVEFRDERVCFFVTTLRQGKHSVTYRLRAEQPGEFSALPAKIWGMYAPELKGNADEFKMGITD